jgi:KaiC/GvpD/RAD55 family RecA-like ATPase
LASTGIPALDQILSDGYPDRSSVLVIGQAGIGKEALGYWFIRSGLIQGDYCLYVSHRRTTDVLRDMKAYGIPVDRVPEWLTGAGSSLKCDLSDYTSISFNIKQAIARNAGRRVRVVTDIISPLLALNSEKTMYDYWSRLLAELKGTECIILALAEAMMHSQSTVASLEQQFDGVIELTLHEEGLSITPLLRVRKMLGQQPILGYFRFSFGRETVVMTPYAK